MGLSLRRLSRIPTTSLGITALQAELVQPLRNPLLPPLGAAPTTLMLPICPAASELTFVRPSCPWSHSKTKQGAAFLPFSEEQEGTSACPGSSPISSLSFPAAPNPKQHQGLVLELAGGGIAPQGLLSWKAEASKPAALPSSNTCCCIWAVWSHTSSACLE